MLWNLELVTEILVVSWLCLAFLLRRLLAGTTAGATGTARLRVGHITIKILYNGS